jgi:hypothetical protein
MTHFDFISGLDPFDQLVDVSRMFVTKMHEVLIHDVDCFNIAAQSPIAQFVNPNFTDANSYAAPESLLWQLDLSRFLAPEDEAIAERRAACGNEKDPAKLVDVRASAGHPNVAGAVHFHAAIVPALRQLGVIP